MNTGKKLATLAAVLALGVGGYAFADSSEDAGPGFGPPFLQHGMGGMIGPRMGGPGMMMGMGRGSATMEQHGIIHQLLANHDRVRRTVTNLPDGIRTETTSDDPRVAEWIKNSCAQDEPEGGGW